MIGEEIEIFRIAVSYRKRRQGIGKEILEFLLKFRKKKNVFS
ncbi:acetyltransferase, GNAT domain protein [Leptospira interrogans serovar Australis str. 200703203]|uniref:Acetyltransferase, GNAT domain protein n=1 Tax=Leptospira interrogans serovar Australis str. 200703203 TaxID=1085541 RepID=N1UGE0_LEPIR|nr:acetyltransferase, GNAT domain protein [Leptospira interrogans serovar Australis str. 200703203]